MPPVKPSFIEPDDAMADDRWDDLRVAALCIGVQAYKGRDALGNTVRDAEAIFDRINQLPRCRAAMLVDPKSSDEIYKAVREQFLKPLSRRPPELVIIFYAGHGFQVDSNLFLIPTGADYRDAAGCQNTCTSHLTVLKWLKEFLDDPAKDLRYSSDRPPVRFLLAFDMCRELLGAIASLVAAEPEQQSAPHPKSGSKAPTDSLTSTSRPQI